MKTTPATTSFEHILSEMKAHGMSLPPRRVHIAIPHARSVLQAALGHFIALEHKTARWLPEYDQVADWLADNRGRGLFLYGNCGRGKTLLARYVLPAILLQYNRLVVSTFDAQEMNANIDRVLSKHIVSLDDIGTEETAVSYGNRRMAFAEITDRAEKRGHLLIITSNLSGEQLRERYKDRVYERILATTRRILFQGESLRRRNPL